MTPLSKINAMTAADFVRTVGHVFEHSPWIAERAFARKPFASVGDLHEKMCGVVTSSSQDEKLALIRAHPDLVGRMAQPLTRESQSEQAAAGLTQLSEADREAFNRYNAAYRDKFGFPFVICARENRKDAILAAFPRRLEHSRDAEIDAAIGEIFKIAKLRLIDAINEEG
jgi:2-oxo-4-hydroxy-4-carboxy-5-ureidoimidazoline decarboxylase